MRSFRKESIQGAMDRFATRLQEIGCSRNIDMRMESRPVSRQIEFDPEVIQKISDICHTFQFSFRKMPSMAGHDAGHMAALAPAAMIFIPSEGGRSHCPEEWSDFEKIAKGALVLGSDVISAQAW